MIVLIFITIHHYLNSRINGLGITLCKIGPHVKSQFVNSILKLSGFQKLATTVFICLGRPKRSPFMDFVQSGYGDPYIGSSLSKRSVQYVG